MLDGSNVSTYRRSPRGRPLRTADALILVTAVATVLASLDAVVAFLFIGLQSAVAGLVMGEKGLADWFISDALGFLPVFVPWRSSGSPLGSSTRVIIS